MTHPGLDGLDFEVEFEGHKTSEGDGRTAEDIEQEMSDQESPEEEEQDDGTQ